MDHVQVLVPGTYSRSRRNGVGVLHQHLHAASVLAEFDAVLPQNRRQRRRCNIDIGFAAIAFDGSPDGVEVRVACCQVQSQVAGNRHDDP